MWGGGGGQSSNCFVYPKFYPNQGQTSMGCFNMHEGTSDQATDHSAMDK